MKSRAPVTLLFLFLSSQSVVACSKNWVDAPASPSAAKSSNTNAHNKVEQPANVSTSASTATGTTASTTNSTDAQTDGPWEKQLAVLFKNYCGTCHATSFGAVTGKIADKDFVLKAATEIEKRLRLAADQPGAMPQSGMPRPTDDEKSLMLKFVRGELK